jgi:hypothetical protein
MGREVASPTSKIRESDQGQRLGTQSRATVEPTVLADSPAGELQTPGAATRAGARGRQAAWLLKGRLHDPQRQALVAHIGRAQGNSHLQQVLAAVRRQAVAGAANGQIQLVRFGSNGGLSAQHQAAVRSAAQIAERLVRSPDFRRKWDRFWRGRGANIRPRPSLAQYQANRTCARWSPRNAESHWSAKRLQ